MHQRKRYKAFSHIGNAISIGMGAVILGTMALTYWPTYEFSKETMRGGRSELTQKDKKNETKGGLDKDYAFQWSYGKAETMTLLVPNAFGGSSAEGLGEELKSNRSFAGKCTNITTGFCPANCTVISHVLGRIVKYTGHRLFRRYHLSAFFIWRILFVKVNTGGGLLP